MTAGVEKTQVKGMKRVINATAYSFKGLTAAWKYEAAFRQEAVLAVLLTFVALILPISSTEKVALIACVVFVMVVELLNSAIEAVVDRVGMEHHELSGRAKDMGSAAVFLSLCLTFGVWVTILFL